MAAAGKPAAGKATAEKPAAGNAAEKAAAPAEPPVAEQWVTLGSADPADPYRMLVTLTNRGAAVVRIEANSDRYRAIDDNVVPPYVVTNMPAAGWAIC